MCNLKRAREATKEAKKIGTELPSPSDVILQDDIRYLETAKKLEVSLDNLQLPLTKPPKVWITTVTDTNSMDPVVDYQHSCILVAGADEPEQEKLCNWLQPGNVVVFYALKLIMHRIIKITEDEKGRRYHTKGDNCPVYDPYVTRNQHIRWLLIGILY